VADIKEELIRYGNLKKIIQNHKINLKQAYQLYYFFVDNVIKPLRAFRPWSRLSRDYACPPDPFYSRYIGRAGGWKARRTGVLFPPVGGQVMLK
jgi:hypothetical protein